MNSYRTLATEIVDQVLDSSELELPEHRRQRLITLIKLMLEDFHADEWQELVP